jgi:hypothetical protein
MTEERKKNPVKQLAMHLAHQMDREKTMHDELLPQWKLDEIRAEGKYLRDEMWKKGYDVHAVLAYAEEYKTLSWADYREWVYI